jgi:hypothetical protein
VLILLIVLPRLLLAVVFWCSGVQSLASLAGAVLTALRGGGAAYRKVTGDSCDGWTRFDDDGNASDVADPAEELKAAIYHNHISPCYKSFPLYREMMVRLTNHKADRRGISWLA